MQRLRYGFLLALLCLCFRDANAYRANVLDPPAASGSVVTHIETGDQFSVTFDPCQANELPGGNTGDGCFAIFNRSGDTWTSLTLTAPNNAALGGQGVACNTDPNSLAYSSSSCNYDPVAGLYTLFFNNGAFPSGTANTLFIVETGIRYDQFPTLGAVAGTTVTPEPGSALLLGTGLCGVALLVRRRVLPASARGV